MRVCVIVVEAERVVGVEERAQGVRGHADEEAEIGEGHRRKQVVSLEMFNELDKNRLTLLRIPAESSTTRFIELPRTPRRNCTGKTYRWMKKSTAPV